MMTDEKDERIVVRENAAANKSRRINENSLSTDREVVSDRRIIYFRGRVRSLATRRGGRNPFVRFTRLDRPRTVKNDLKFIRRVLGHREKYQTYNSPGRNSRSTERFISALFRHASEDD